MRDQGLVAVLSGANMNFDRLRFVAERAELGEAREALLAVTIPERPGAFREFCATIGRRVVTEFNYRLSGRKQAHIFVGIATESREDATARSPRCSSRAATRRSTSPRTRWRSCTCGTWSAGRAPDARHERLCRFEFPERPGALMQFLEKLGGRWNISLFHYRNHGADFGRVLAGFEVPDGDMGEFQNFLDGLGYDHVPRRRERRLQFLSAVDGSAAIRRRSSTRKEALLRYVAYGALLQMRCQPRIFAVPPHDHAGDEQHRRHESDDTPQDLDPHPANRPI